MVNSSFSCLYVPCDGIFGLHSEHVRVSVWNCSHESTGRAVLTTRTGEYIDG